MNFCFPKTNLKKVKWPGETAIDMGKNGDLCWHVCKCGATAHPLGGAEGSEAAISQPHKFWVPVWAQGSCAVRCVNQQQVSSVFRSRSLCWVFRAVGDLFSNRWHWNAHLSRPLVAGQGAETERQVGPSVASFQERRGTERIANKEACRKCFENKAPNKWDSSVGPYDKPLHPMSFLSPFYSPVK